MHSSKKQGDEAVIRSGQKVGEGMGYDECCEICKPDDSQTCTPGDKNTLYVY